MNILKFNITVAMQHFALGTLIASFYLYAAQNSITLTDLTWISLGTSVLSFVVEPISSYIADKYGKKKILIAGYVLLFLSFLSFIILTSYWAFIIQQTLATLAMASLSGTEEAFLHDLTEKETTEKTFTSHLSLMQIYDEIGTIAGTLTIGLLGQFVGYRYGFISALITIFIGGVILFSIKYKEQLEDGEVKINFENPLEDFRGFKQLIKKKAFLIPLFFGIVLFVFANFRGDETWQLAMTQSGLSVAFVGILFALGKVASLLSSWLVYKFESKIGFKMAIFVGFLLQLIAYISMVQLNNIFVSLGLILFYFGENLIRPYIKSFILNSAPKSLKSTFLSVITGFSNLVEFPLIFVLSFYSDQNIKYGLLFMILAKSIALITVILFVFTRVKKYASVKRQS